MGYKEENKIRVYFLASITGKKLYFDYYKEIIRLLKKYNCEVEEYVSTCTKDSLLAQTTEERIRDHKKLQRAAKKADLIVAEASYPSTSAGYEIARALDWEKPVLVLYSEDAECPTILKGRMSDKFLLESYNKENLGEVIKGALDYFKTVSDIRFTFLLPAPIIQYLDWVAEHKKIPRSVFIRETLLEKMKNDKEYSKSK